VSVPYQSYSATGAVIAGPIVKCIIEGPWPSRQAPRERHVKHVPG